MLHCLSRNEREEEAVGQKSSVIHALEKVLIFIPKILIVVENGK